MEIVLANDRLFLVRGSRLSVSSSTGIVKKFSRFIMSELNPAENSCTCLLMYNRNASLDHLPSNIIVDTGLRARYRAIAKLDRTECVPTSFFSNPKPSIDSTVFPRCLNISFPVMYLIDFPISTVFTGDDSEDFGYVSIR